MGEKLRTRFIYLCTDTKADETMNIYNNWNGFRGTPGFYLREAAAGRKTFLKPNGNYLATSSKLARVSERCNFCEWKQKTIVFDTAECSL